ncbi:hypothetical protein PAHAL_9G142400 [Panicum hallii]|uniref:Uncharacterized protein n=1 Tax=Panicum hallii TaxID=206008 RepID=A0A2S3IJI9_9POAL|nr:uncharacterized protein LOC112878042 isoform X2 [Panicum hallii]PAN45789.1 hypothetical protein PAHAL_9G142400 [Panicum hallii]
MQRVSQLALLRLLSPPSAAAAARRAAPVTAEAVSGGGSILLPRGGGAGVAASIWSGGGPGIRLARRLCTYDERDDRALEEEAEKKFGWILKIFFLGTAGLVGYQFFPYMGDNLLQQSISLLRVKDPLFKRMGASRLTRFAVDEEAAGFLDKAGAYAIVSSTPNSPEYAEIETYKTSLLTAIDKLKS